MKKESLKSIGLIFLILCLVKKPYITKKKK